MKFDCDELSRIVRAEEDFDELGMLPVGFLDDFSGYFRGLIVCFRGAGNVRESELLDDEIRSVRTMFFGLMDRRRAKIIGLAIVENVDKRKSVGCMLPCEYELYNIVCLARGKNELVVNNIVDSAYERRV